MLWIRKVTGEDIRSTYKWLSKDPPFATTCAPNSMGKNKAVEVIGEKLT